jgi:small subunit ribosomal protein S7
MRRKQAKKRKLTPDPKFSDPLVTRFVNSMMWDGKKSVAYRIFYDTMELIENKEKENGYEVWKKAMNNVAPGVEVRSRRIGGATFQIPTEIRPDRKISVAIKWIITYSRARAGKSMAEKLAAELVAASRNEGGAIKKKEDTHKMAEANKAFSHFRV